jgi:hypothetical protein
MAAIDPGMRAHARSEAYLRKLTRLTVVAAYVTAAIVGLILVRPAFVDSGAPSIVIPEPTPAATDVLRKHESVATFAARHGLDLADVLTLNPKLNSLDLPAGTRLRIR